MHEAPGAVKVDTERIAADGMKGGGIRRQCLMGEKFWLCKMNSVDGRW